MGALMASAWGRSFGSAWGSSWGRIRPAVVALQNDAIAPGGPWSQVSRSEFERLLFKPDAAVVMRPKTSKRKKRNMMIAMGVFK
jgi:hypothetical protein